MRARRLLEGTTYSAETLTAIFRAFDEAWGEVAHLFPSDADDARERLAHALLIVAKEDSRDARFLKNEALQVFALALRPQFREG
jgi:hypothetical protein